LRQKLVRIVGGVALAALVVGGAAACKNDTTTTTTTNSAACGLELGFFGALTGDNAGLVVPEQQGAQLAIDQYNAAHSNCTVTLSSSDSQGDPTKAPGLATAMVNNAKIVGVIGPAFSGESAAADPIFNQAVLATITPSATRPSLSTNGWAIFHRGVGNDYSQGPAGARYLVNVVGAKKVFEVSDDSAYGKGLYDAAGPVLQPVLVGTDHVTTGDRTFTATVTKIIGAQADAVYYGGYTAEASPFLKQLRAAGWHGQFIGGDGINDSNMISATGNADVEGTVATCPCAPAHDTTFINAFKAKYSIAPAVYADVSYDIAKIYLSAISAGKTTRADINTYLSTYSGKGSASGVTYSWPAADKGELDPTQVVVYAFAAQNGAWVAKQAIPSS
jgi:branched-chain amino acid transport system substrate-binding protein